ncbi:MAG TPA: ABC transporter ATP-binding protein, partial [Gemmatales bacterium]|nr:ABC transporter ATP-binding protein [Gemmatales bacterium]
MNDSIQVRENLGYLPENVPLYPEMRVTEYLQYRAQLKGVVRGKRAERLGYVIDRCRLEGVKRRLVGTLSRGYRQRVG